MADPILEVLGILWVKKLCLFRSLFGEHSFLFIKNHKNAVPEGVKHDADVGCVALGSSGQLWSALGCY